MEALQKRLAAKQESIIAFLKELVECESPSDDRAAVDRFVDLFAESVRDIAKVRTVKGGRFGRHMVCEIQLPGARKRRPQDVKQCLALGHGDTVWPMGTLKTMPWRKADGRLWGPGIFDMKAGLALFVFAMRALRELDLPVARKMVLQVNSDEEVGSGSSRELTERSAKASEAVLVLEPAAGLKGDLKTARKGVGDYTVRVQGVSAHAGLDFEKGSSAIVELAHQIEKIATFTDLKRGITVNPGVIRGGTRGNVIAGEAEVACDLRLWKASHFPALKRKFAALKPVDRRCSIAVDGGLNRPPFERTLGTVKLLRLAQKISEEQGIALGEAAVGGGSDGNFTSGLGVPTLDGLGAVGEGAHAAHESILVNRLVDRAVLLAELVRRLGSEPAR